MSEDDNSRHGFCSFVKSFFNRRQPETVRETIEDLLEEANINGEEQFSAHEQLLLNNILCLRDKKCGDAMIPRADIVGFPESGNVGDLARLMTTKGHSRIPVYRESFGRYRRRCPRYRAWSNACCPAKKMLKLPTL